MGDSEQAIRRDAERLVAQAEAQGLPRTVDNPEQLEALGRIISAVMEQKAAQGKGRNA
jgi:hypothetical protein